MKYPKLASVLGWAQEPANIEQGAYLQAVELPVVETAIETGATAQAQVQALTDRATTAENSLATANTTIAGHEATIATLNAQIETLKKGDAGTANPDPSAADTFPKNEVSAMEMSFQQELLSKL